MTATVALQPEEKASALFPVQSEPDSGEESFLPIASATSSPAPCEATGSASVAPGLNVGAVSASAAPTSQGIVTSASSIQKNATSGCHVQKKLSCVPASTALAPLSSVASTASDVSAAFLPDKMSVETPSGFPPPQEPCVSETSSSGPAEAPATEEEERECFAAYGSDDDLSEQNISEETLAHIRQSAESFKSQGNTFFSQAIAETDSSQKQNLFNKALEAFGNAIQACRAISEPERIDTYHVALSNRSFVHIKLENFGLAIMDAECAIKANPLAPKPFYRRGTAYAAVGKFKLALTDFKTSYRLCANQETLAKIQICTKQIRQMDFASAIFSERTKPLSQRIDWEAIPRCSPTYTGPRYRKDPAFLKELVDFIKEEGNLLPLEDVDRIVYDVIELLRSVSCTPPGGGFHCLLHQGSCCYLHQTPTLVNIELGPSEGFTVCGDVHGQFFDLLNIFELNGFPSETNPYLFNGDFVDRGSFSLECVLTLFVAKLLFPQSVHLARGNHETRNMNKFYGFHGEVVSKYDATLYELFCEAFCLLPLAHTINNKVFIVHGGLFAEDGVKLSDIAKIDRNMEPPDEGIMTELLWSDPQPDLGRSPSKRGIGCAFGPDVTDSFLKANNLDYVIRSHEMKQLGYEVEHCGKLITVFSAPNYCDKMENLGAFIRLQGDNLQPRYTTFKAVPHPDIPAMKYANPIFC